MRKLLIGLALLSLSAASLADGLADIVTKGSTDRSVTVDIIDSTDGTPETGVVFNTSGIDLWYRREGAAVTSITEATLASLTTAHSDGGFLHVANGKYRLDLPDAAFATGANYVDFGGTVTGMIVIGGRVRLIDASLEVANLAANITQAGGSNITATGGRMEVNTTHLAGSSLSTLTGAYPALGIIDSGTAQGGTGTTLQLRSAANFTADNRITGATCLITAGTGAGEAQTVASYVNSTDTATMSGTWPTTPASDSVYICFGTAPGSGGGSSNITQIEGTDATDVLDARIAAAGLATASALTTLTNRVGTPSDLGGGATVAGNLADIEAQTDDIGVAGAGLTGADDAVLARLPAALVSGRMDVSVGAYQSGLAPLQPTTAGRTLDVSTGGEAGIDWANVGSPTTSVSLSGTTVGVATSIGSTGLNSTAWPSSWDAEVQSEANDALVANSLDMLFASAYNPASKPGNASGLLNVLVENDGGVPRYTANALEQGPAGGGGGTNITQIEGVDATDQIDARIAAAGLATASALTTLTNRVGTPSDLGGGATVAGNLADIEAQTDDIGVAGAGLTGADDAVLARLPAALVSGRMDVSVGAYQSGLAPLQPTTAGRTLDVSTGGEAGIDWANVGSPTTSVSLSGTTTAWNASWDAEVQSEATDAINAIVITEPTAKPAWGGTLAQFIAWLALPQTNEVRQTSTTKSIRNDANSANIVTCPVSDNGTTFTLGECTP